MTDGLRQTVLLDDGDVALVDVRCRVSASGPSSVETAHRLELVLPRAGTFARHTSAGDVLADPARIVIFRPWERYRISHPLGMTDRSLAIGLRAEAVRELGSAGATRELPSSMRIDLAARRLADGLALGSLDPLALGGEVRMLAAAILAPSRAAPDRHVAVRPGHRRLVRRTRLVLIERLGERLTLPELAATVGSSPYHLARVFRAVTATSIHEHRVGLRVRAALERVSLGEDDLTGLALDLGFVDHAHMTTTVRRAVGRPPSAFRAAATPAEIRSLRTILQA